MKLSTYTLKKSDKELIGLLYKDSLINLNVFFGEICLLELIQLPNWKELIIKKTKSNNLTTHTQAAVSYTHLTLPTKA